MIKQPPRMVKQDIAQHLRVTRRQRMMYSFAGKTLFHPAFRGRTVDLRQFRRQFPLATLAQKATKQRVIAKPLARVVHALQE